MKKVMVLAAFVLFFYPMQSLCKPIFNILDSECIVFIQGSALDSNISVPLEVFLNTVNKANLQIWYIKNDQYSRIKFNNNTYLELDNYPDDTSIFLYKMRRTPFIGQINGVFLCHAELNILMNYAERYCVNILKSKEVYHPYPMNI